MSLLLSIAMVQSGSVRHLVGAAFLVAAFLILRAVARQVRCEHREALRKYMDRVDE